MRWWPPWRTPPDALLGAGLAVLVAALYVGGVFERLEFIAIDLRYR